MSKNQSPPTQRVPPFTEGILKAPLFLRQLQQTRFPDWTDALASLTPSVQEQLHAGQFLGASRTCQSLCYRGKARSVACGDVPRRIIVGTFCRLYGVTVAGGTDLMVTKKAILAKQLPSYLSFPDMHSRTQSVMHFPGIWRNSSPRLCPML